MVLKGPVQKALKTIFELLLVSEFLIYAIVHGPSPRPTGQTLVASCKWRKKNPHVRPWLVYEGQGGLVVTERIPRSLLVSRRLIDRRADPAVGRVTRKCLRAGQ